MDTDGEPAAGSVAFERPQRCNGSKPESSDSPMDNNNNSSNEMEQPASRTTTTTTMPFVRTTDKCLKSSSSNEGRSEMFDQRPSSDQSEHLDDQTANLRQIIESAEIKMKRRSQWKPVGGAPDVTATQSEALEARVEPPTTTTTTKTTVLSENGPRRGQRRRILSASRTLKDPAFATITLNLDQDQDEDQDQDRNQDPSRGQWAAKQEDNQQRTTTTTGSNDGRESMSRCFEKNYHFQQDDSNRIGGQDCVPDKQDHDEQQQQQHWPRLASGLSDRRRKSEASTAGGGASDNNNSNNNENIGGRLPVVMMTNRCNDHDDHDGDERDRPRPHQSWPRPVVEWDKNRTRDTNVATTTATRDEHETEMTETRVAAHFGSRLRTLAAHAATNQPNPKLDELEGSQRGPHDDREAGVVARSWADKDCGQGWLWPEGRDEARRAGLCGRQEHEHEQEQEHKVTQCLDELNQDQGHQDADTTRQDAPTPTNDLIRTLLQRDRQAFAGQQQQQQQHHQKRSHAASSAAAADRKRRGPHNSSNCADSNRPMEMKLQDEFEASGQAATSQAAAAGGRPQKQQHQHHHASWQCLLGGGGDSSPLIRARNDLNMGSCCGNNNTNRDHSEQQQAVKLTSKSRPDKDYDELDKCLGGDNSNKNNNCNQNITLMSNGGGGQRLPSNSFGAPEGTAHVTHSKGRQMTTTTTELDNDNEQQQQQQQNNESAGRTVSCSDFNSNATGQRQLQRIATTTTTTMADDKTRTTSSGEQQQQQQRRRRHSVLDLSSLINKCQKMQLTTTTGASSSGTNDTANSDTQPAAEGGHQLVSPAARCRSQLSPYRLAARALQSVQAAACSARTSLAGAGRSPTPTPRKPSDPTGQTTLKPEELSKLITSSRRRQQQQQSSPLVQPRRHSTYMLPLLLLRRAAEGGHSDDDDDDDDDSDNEVPVSLELDDADYYEDDYEDDDCGLGDICGDSETTRRRASDGSRASCGGGGGLLKRNRPIGGQHPQQQPQQQQQLPPLGCTLSTSASSPSALSTPTNEGLGCGGPCCSHRAQLVKLAAENAAAVDSTGAGRRARHQQQQQQQGRQQTELGDQTTSNSGPMRRQQRIGSNPLELRHSQQHQLVDIRRLVAAGGASQRQRPQLAAHAATAVSRHANKRHSATIAAGLTVGRRLAAASKLTAVSANTGAAGTLPGRLAARCSMSGGGPSPGVAAAASRLKQQQKHAARRTSDGLVMWQQHQQRRQSLGQGQMASNNKLLPTNQPITSNANTTGGQLVNENELYDPLIPESGFKIVVMGTSGSGKTSIIQRFLYGTFSARHLPTVEDTYFIEFPYKKSRINISVSDTSGTYQFPAMRRLAINSGDAFILVYSVDDPQSFDDLEQLRETILNEREQAFLEASGGSLTSNESTASSSSSSGLASGGSSISQGSVTNCGLATAAHSLHPAGRTHQHQDMSPSRHWSLASLFNHQHHHQHHNQQQQPQQTSYQHPDGGPSSISSSSFCSSASSSTDNSRRSSISAAEAALKTRRTRRPPMVIVANKHDLPKDKHQINSDEIEALAVIDWNNGFVRASAALNWNIDEIFQQVLKQARQPPTLTEAIVSKRRKSLPPKLPHP